MSTPDTVAATGKALALRMLTVIAPEDYDPPALIHAMAFMLSALLTAMDGSPTISESMGGQLLDDSQRLDMFRVEVEELAKRIRAERGPQKGLM